MLHCALESRNMTRVLFRWHSNFTAWKHKKDIRTHGGRAQSGSVIWKLSNTVSYNCRGLLKLFHILMWLFKPVRIIMIKYAQICGLKFCCVRSVERIIISLVIFLLYFQSIVSELNTLYLDQLRQVIGQFIITALLNPTNSHTSDFGICKPTHTHTLSLECTLV